MDVEKEIQQIKQRLDALENSLPPRGLPRTKFIKPTPEQLRQYAAEIGYEGFDPQAFVDHYEAKGWVVGKSPMKDWRAAVRTWQRNTGKGNDKAARTTRTWGRICYHCGSNIGPDGKVRITMLFVEERPWCQVSCYQAWVKEGRPDYEKES